MILDFVVWLCGCVSRELHEHTRERQITTQRNFIFVPNLAKANEFMVSRSVWYVNTVYDYISTNDNVLKLKFTFSRSVDSFDAIAVARVTSMPSKIIYVVPFWE